MVSLRGVFQFTFLGFLLSINGLSIGNEQAQLDKSAEGDQGKRAYVRSVKGSRQLQSEPGTGSTSTTPSTEDAPEAGNSTDTELIDLVLELLPNITDLINITDLLGPDSNLTTADLSALTLLLPSLLSGNSTDGLLFGNNSDLSEILSSLNLTSLLANGTDLSEILSSLNLTDLLSSNTTGSDLSLFSLLASLLGLNSTLGDNSTGIIDQLALIPLLFGNGTGDNFTDILDLLLNSTDLEGLADIYNITGLNVTGLSSLEDLINLIGLHLDFFASKSPEELVAFLSNYTIDDFLTQHNGTGLFGDNSTLEEILEDLGLYTILTGNDTLSDLVETILNSTDPLNLTETVYDLLGFNTSSLSLTNSSGLGDLADIIYNITGLNTSSLLSLNASGLEDLDDIIYNITGLNTTSLSLLNSSDLEDVADAVYNITGLNISYLFDDTLTGPSASITKGSTQEEPATEEAPTSTSGVPAGRRLKASKKDASTSGVAGSLGSSGRSLFQAAADFIGLN